MSRVSLELQYRAAYLIGASIFCALSPVISQDTVSLSASGATFDFVWVPVDALGVVKRVQIGDSSGKHPKENKRNESIYAPFERNGQRGYYLGKTEVTEEEWAAVTGEGTRTKFPVSGKAYSEIQVFLDKINATARQSDGFPCTPDGAPGVIKLPTEAEWEYAARGGNWSQYGDSDPYAGDLERYEVFSLPGSDGKAKEVASRPPNRLGLHDMLGNVRELMEGNYSVGGVTGGGLLLKGASYLSEKGELRSSLRTEHQRTGKDGKTTRRPDAGLRLALSAELFTSLGRLSLDPPLLEDKISEQPSDSIYEQGMSFSQLDLPAERKQARFIQAAAFGFCLLIAGFLPGLILFRIRRARVKAGAFEDFEKFENKSKGMSSRALADELCKVVAPYFGAPPKLSGPYKTEREYLDTAVAMLSCGVGFGPIRANNDTEKRLKDFLGVIDCLRRAPRHLADPERPKAIRLAKSLILWITSQ